MANFPSVTAAGAFESAAVQNAIKTLAAQAVETRLAALERTTGWRSITLSSGTGGSLFLKRDGSRVSMVLTAFRPGATGTVPLADLPAGFRPRYTIPMWGDETGVPRPIYANAFSPYRLELRAIATVGSYVYASGVWDTSDTWPTTPPGTPA